jgi:hypothetical protein
MIEMDKLELLESDFTDEQPPVARRADLEAIFNLPFCLIAFLPLSAYLDKPAHMDKEQALVPFGTGNPKGAELAWMRATMEGSIRIIRLSGA